jgi:hypothetical protein
VGCYGSRRGGIGVTAAGEGWAEQVGIASWSLSWNAMGAGVGVLASLQQARVGLSKR